MHYPWIPYLDIGLHVGRNLQKLRTARRYSRKELAQRASVNQSTIRRFETDVTQLQFRTLQKILFGLGYDTEIRFVPTRGKRKF